MRFLNVLVLSILLLLLEVGLEPGRAPLVRPDFLLVATLLWGLTLGMQQALLSAAVAGLLLDAVSAAPMGMHVVALMVSTLPALLRDRELVESRFVLALLLSPVATALYYGVTLLVLLTTGRPIDWAGQLVERVAPAAVLNTLLTIPLYVVIALLAARLGMSYAGTAVRRSRYL